MWVSPTGFNDPSSTWSSEPLAYDGNTGTYTYTSVPKNGWSGYLELSIAPISCDKVRGWFNEGAANVNNFELDVYYGGTWHNIQSGEPVYGQWVEFPIGSTQIVSAMRFRFYSTKAAAAGGWCNEAEFNEITIVETISTKEFPMRYYQTSGVEELSSKVTGATVSKVNNDFPPALLKTGKANSLVSKWS